MVLILFFLKIFRFDGGFFLRGSGDIELYIDPTTSIQTTLSFTSPNFDTDGPTDASLSCSADVQIEDLDFNRFFLNMIAPLLIEAIEPEVEPMICEPIEAMEDLLAEAIMNVTSIFDDFNQPLPPELANPLYPEQELAPFLEASNSDYIDFAPILDTLKGPLESIFQFLMDFFIGEDGTLSVPFSMPIAEGVDLVEIRLVGFKNFTFDPFSMIGNHTIQTVYEQNFLGLEMDVGIVLPDNTTEVVEVKAGINNLALSISSLLVVEALADIPWTKPILALSSLLDKFLAFEISGFSITSASLASIEVSGLSDYQGPSKLLNEVSEAIFFMYDGLLIKSLNFFFETEVRDVINNIVATRSKTCTEKLLGKTFYIPTHTACYEAQLFEGGLLSVDTSDPGCLNEFYMPNQNMSIFDNATESAVYFEEGQFGWKGKIEFIDDNTKSRMFVRPTLDIDEKTFDIGVFLPGCSLVPLAQSCS